MVAALGRLSADDLSLLAGLHRPGTTCVALIAPQPIGPAGAAEAAETSSATLLRSGGWDVVQARAGETFDRTWARVGPERGGGVAAPTLDPAGRTTAGDAR
ncbi:hypothetical protein GCM10025868_06840 [Angustibacter aerolatus]|uniref:Uncharacterized protein n=1 Tax=Angustibacter aerolatus TaxID=1162965 RepID=A0ABQ6JDC1_9ACTN|nr:hypothetical protein GCM10025868_06840 [Angustibacter aerolatus]